MKAQNTINLGQISGEMKTWNNFILRPKGLTDSHERLMGVGPRTNVCNIGGDPLTQLIFFY